MKKPMNAADRERKVVDERRRNQLRNIPGVDSVLQWAKADAFFDHVPKSVLTNAARAVTDMLRSSIQAKQNDVDPARFSQRVVLNRLKESVTEQMTPNLRKVVNATGVVVHTNLGRSLLPQDALANLSLIGGKFSNLEFDIKEGRRGSRYSAVEGLLCEICGAEAAMVVNNNAGAVLLSLDTLAKDKHVIVSRGELVEIGGSFRIPDVMAKSGAVLKEVGTTNRTHYGDYENAIDGNTGLLLKVHASNYCIVGFKKEVSLKELVTLGSTHRIPVMEDLGSGTLVDFSEYGLMKEPTVQESVKTGADIITFSGDKLLGGPQAGIILGKTAYIKNIKKNPLTRALRIDKLTLAALETTLRHYREPQRAVFEIPTLRMLTQPLRRIEEKAMALKKRLNATGISVRLMDIASKAGGGSLPLLELPSKCIGISVAGMSANAVERTFRYSTPPVIGRIEDDIFIMDLRTIEEDDFEDIESAAENLFSSKGML
ncbi:MAG: L-seryl-tRNA(Sec) selenium transferase [Desulfobacterales bacterium]